MRQKRSPRLRKSSSHSRGTIPTTGDITKVEDANLLIRIAKHDEAAFNELHSRYRVKVKQLCYSITRDKEGMLDALQDTFTTVWTKAKTFRFKSAVSSWIYRIAFNCALMWLRVMKRKSLKFSARLVSVDALEGATVQRSTGKLYSRTSPDTNLKEIVLHSAMLDQISIEDAEELKLLRQRIFEALEKVSQDKLPIVILYTLGHSSEEVAKKRKITIPAAKSKLWRGRATLRKELNSDVKELEQRLINYRKAA